ncbi:MAG: Hdr-like menaquinol oxidoreductase cytochrome c subunit [Rhodospirillales bacterium]|nr:Hdr-like menaquinol oxidoreductase cytochrome c subunit [Rhodospirillales bacterium]
MGTKGKIRTIIAFFVFVMALAFGGASLVVAADVPQPVTPKGKECVRDAAFMRANHMNLLKHKRDDTVYQGVRSGNDGLKDCVTCHAIPDDHGKPVGADDSRHFCRTCHDYAAVTMDCFQCHTSKPGGVSK